MEQTVYVLGAGFSAPLGVPVMADFLVKAKDLYSDDRAGLEHFAAVFERIRKLHVVKSYFRSDLQNIEEILSIVEMDDAFSGGAGQGEIHRFLADVITRCTPDLPSDNRGFPSNWHDFLFPTGNWKPFGMFAAAILRLKFENTARPATVIPEVSALNDGGMKYSVVTLNYDKVLESLGEYIQRRYRCQGEFGFRRAGRSTSDGSPGNVDIAKLHGSIDDQRIVPPTWNKSLNEAILPDWQLALKKLRGANHIRVIGYSLPDTDAYVRYLFKASVSYAEHLKSFHVICRDDDGSVKRRYDTFVDFNYYRFFSATTENYLAAVDKWAASRIHPAPDLISFDGLERAHARFVSEYAVKRTTVDDHANSTR